MSFELSKSKIRSDLFPDIELFVVNFPVGEIDAADERHVTDLLDGRLLFEYFVGDGQLLALGIVHHVVLLLDLADHVVAQVDRILKFLFLSWKPSSIKNFLEYMGYFFSNLKVST